MATTLLLRIIALVLAVSVHVYCEQCTVNGDCKVTGCDSKSHVICQHKDPNQGTVPNGGLCTCALNNYVCRQQSDCQSAPLDCDRNRHCYDSKCICTRW